MATMNSSMSLMPPMFRDDVATFNPPIFGTPGNDTLTGTTSNDVIDGGNGDDVISGNRGMDVLFGDNGNDTLNGGDSNDALFGEDGDDIINGDRGSDLIRAGNGNDTLNGGDDDDALFGGNGNDVMFGGNGKDVLQGGDNNDFLRGGDGDNTLLGGDGDDFIDGGKDIDKISGGNGIDGARGGASNDELSGDGGNDTLLGEAGNDTLAGGDGDDILDGDAVVKLLGLTDRNMLVNIDANIPGQTTSTPVTGVDGTLVGIDVRPADGKLYGLTDTNKVYTIDASTGQATLVSTLNLPFNGGQLSGVDFNPAPDRLRVVGSNDENFRINVDTGAVADFDPVRPGIQPDQPLTFAAGDPNFGKSPTITAAAYTRSFAPSPDPARPTTLYEIDSDQDVLVRQGGLDFVANVSPASDSPNLGMLTTIGKLGVDFGTTGGFDILETPNGVRLPLAVSNSTLYSIDLGSGAATNLGQIGDGSFKFVGFAAMIADDPTIRGDDKLSGGAGNDVLFGRAGRDQLDGGSGNDTLDGGMGRDTLIGGTENDQLTGGAANDTLTGGSGMDNFVYGGTAPFQPNLFGVDRITDFKVGMDKIVLDQTVFGPLTTAQIAIVNNDRAVDGSAGLIVYSTGSGNLFFNQNGTTAGLGTGSRFSRLDGNPGLTVNDFVIVA